MLDHVTLHTLMLEALFRRRRVDREVLYQIWDRTTRSQGARAGFVGAWGTFRRRLRGRFSESEINSHGRG